MYSNCLCPHDLGIHIMVIYGLCYEIPYLRIGRRLDQKITFGFLRLNILIFQRLEILLQFSDKFHLLQGIQALSPHRDTPRHQHGSEYNDR